MNKKKLQQASRWAETGLNHGVGSPWNVKTCDRANKLLDGVAMDIVTSGVHTFVFGEDRNSAQAFEIAASILMEGQSV